MSTWLRVGMVGVIGVLFWWWKMNNMKISEKGLAGIKKHEGLVLHVYDDGAGFPTIGYGHLIKDGESFTTITEAQASELLRQDVAEAERAVNRLVTVPINQDQFDALVSFTFNLGAGSLKRSTLLRKLNSGGYAGASAEFPRWVRAGGQVMVGLVNRRNDERDLFMGAVA